MKEWFENLSVMEHIFFWLGIAATLFMIIQIVLMCFSSFGGDVDLDGDGDLDVDADSGVSIFTVKSVTAFFAVGSWAGLLVCTLAPDNLQWLAVIVAIITGAAAMAVVVFIFRAMAKMQCNGALQIEKLIGKRATVYIPVPATRGGRGKITLNAQGRYMELDAVTDCEEKLLTDETVEIIATENECTVVRRAEKTEITENENSDNEI
ncbi:MAG: hypothetical protein K2K80_00730 [Clostridia bacterium]|nr:hypothetical protein [Clostridia bacterium]